VRWDCGRAGYTAPAPGRRRWPAQLPPPARPIPAAVPAGISHAHPPRLRGRPAQRVRRLRAGPRAAGRTVAALRTADHRRRGVRRLPGGQSGQGGEGRAGRHPRPAQGPALPPRRLRGHPVPALRRADEGAPGGHDLHREGRGRSAFERDLRPLPAPAGQRAADGVHHRLPAPDGRRQPRAARAGAAAGGGGGDPPPGGLRAGACAAGAGRLAARLRHRRRGAGHRHHHGLHRRRGGRDRPPRGRRPGRHLPRHPARLRLRRPAGPLHAAPRQRGGAGAGDREDGAGVQPARLPAQRGVEFARKALFSDVRPPFADLEAHLRRGR